MGMRRTRVCPSNRTCPVKSVSIATLNTIAPVSWRGRVASSGSGEERHAAGDRSELFAGRVVLTLVGLQGLTRRGLHRWLLPEEEGSHDDEDDPRPHPRYGRQYRRH
jgi:hypothetical protein